MYMDNLPSLGSHLLDMIKSKRYVFAADFLARGYRFDRMAAEKMWRRICIPENTTLTDVTSAIFTSNPDTGGCEEQAGIFESDVLKKASDFGFGLDLAGDKQLLESGSHPNSGDSDVEVGDGMLNLDLDSDDAGSNSDF